MDETLAGPRLLASSSSCSMSYHPATAALISRFMETTKELSKDGGKDEVETSRQMLSSTTFIPSSEPSNAWSTQGMSLARTTWLMSHPKEHTRLLHILCPRYPSPQSYTNSSQTSTWNSPLQALVSTSQQASYPSLTTFFPTTNMPQSMWSLIAGERISSLAPPIARKEGHTWNMHLLTSPPRKHQKPTPYHKNLSPLPSPLCPHCPAGQRLCLWCPLVPRSSNLSQVSDDNLKCIEAVMAHAWEPDTHTMYASSLLNYMVFCDKKSIPKKDRAPSANSCSCLSFRHWLLLILDWR